MLVKGNMNKKLLVLLVTTVAVFTGSYVQSNTVITNSLHVSTNGILSTQPIEAFTNIARDAATLLSEVTTSSNRYIVTFELAQSHFTLSIRQHIADSMNTVKFDVPVDKEYYDSVKVGTVVNNDFRTGSLLLKGSFGNWKVTVVNKEVK